jgi:hypothetical protein
MKLKPLENQARAALAHGYKSIQLVREGDYAVVQVEVGGLYVPVIREHVDGAFCHFVEPLGIEDEIAKFFVEREPLFEFTSCRDWFSKARRLFSKSGHTAEDSICIDFKGRIVDGGGGFERAEQDGAYPVKVYSTKAAED